MAALRMNDGARWTRPAGDTTTGSQVAQYEEAAVAMADVGVGVAQAEQARHTLDQTTGGQDLTTQTQGEQAGVSAAQGPTTPAWKIAAAVGIGLALVGGAIVAGRMLSRR